MATSNTPDEFDVLRNVVEQLQGLPTADQERIIKWACEKLGISEPSRVAVPVIPAGASASTLPGEDATPLPVTTSTNIKTFVEEKNPQTDMHFAVVVAYFYRFLAPEKKEAISAEDLQEATRLAGRARLAKPAKTMNNAATSGLLDNVGRGLYKVNTVGENLVAIVLPGDVKSNPAVKRKNGKKTVTKAKAKSKGKK